MEKLPNRKYKELIAQSNDITTALFSMSPVEMNIVFMFFAQFRDSDPEEKLYRLNLADLEKISGTSINSTRIKKHTWNLKNIQYEISRGGNNYLQIGLFSSIEYFENSRIIEIKIDSKLRPYLFNLTAHFTRFVLDHAVRLKSINSKRLYQLLCMILYKREVGYEVNQLKLVMGLYNDKTKKLKYQNRYGDFKEKVLEPAVREINQITHLRVEYEEIKGWRSVESIVFKVQESPPVLFPEYERRPLARHTELPAPAPPVAAATTTITTSATPEQETWLVPGEENKTGNKNYRSVYERLTTDFGIDAIAARRIVAQQTDLRGVNKILYETKLQLADKKINNPAAYLKKLLLA